MLMLSTIDLSITLWIGTIELINGIRSPIVSAYTVASQSGIIVTLSLISGG